MSILNGLWIGLKERFTTTVKTGTVTPRGKTQNNPSGNTTGREPNKKKQSKGHIVILYTQGLGESIKKTCRKYGIQTHSIGNRTLKILVKPKDKDPIEKKSGSIYYYQCGELTCNEEYIGETSTTFGERFKEHLKEPSPIHVHCT